MKRGGGMDDKAVNLRFRQQLPFRVVVFGRGVTFSQSANGHVATQIEDDYKDVFKSAKTQWDNRKGIWIEGPEQRSNFASMKTRIQSKESIRNFLLFIICQPIGLRLFIFDKSLKFERYIGRQAAINEAYLTWDALRHWERDPDGKHRSRYYCRFVFKVVV